MYWNLSEAVTRMAVLHPEVGITESDLLRCGATGLLVLRAGFYGRCYSPTAALQLPAETRRTGDYTEAATVQAEGLYIVPRDYLAEIELTGSSVVKRAFRGADVVCPFESITADRIRVLQSDLEEFASTIERYQRETPMTGTREAAPTDDDAQPAAHGPAPQGVTRAEIIEGFGLGSEWDERLKKATAGRFAPLNGVWTERGKRGGSPTLYSPAKVGFALMTKYRNGYGRPLRSVTAVSAVLHRVWPDWLDEWDNLRRADGQ
ncbi:MAG: hypothetical protein FHK80_07250 [Azoarcus sp. PHD]|nr:MAG: hypothetical protein FHK80_07250 [Azoarcus sp. PHD]